MEIGLHFIGYLLAFFFAYLYFPNLAFKFGAEYSIDLGRRRDDGELEEFFAAVIPSTILNGFTWILLALLGSPWRYADFPAIAALMTDEKVSIVKAVSDPRNRMAFFGYATALLLVSVFNGIVYGFAVRRKIAQPDLMQRRPQRPSPKKWVRHAWWVVQTLWWVVVELIAGTYYQVWYPIFHEQVVSFFPWTIQRPWIFVRMHGSRLYYGRFVRYDKASDGDVESITIEQVYRYCYDEVNECLAEGRMPLSFFQGSLRIAVAEITDIHNIPERHFQSIESRYKKVRVLRLARDLLTAFSGQTVSVGDIWKRHAGGTHFDIHHYRQALRYLEGEDFVLIAPPSAEMNPNDPQKDAMVKFPIRVHAEHDSYQQRFALPTPMPEMRPEA